MLSMQSIVSRLVRTLRRTFSARGNPPQSPEWLLEYRCTPTDSNPRVWDDKAFGAFDDFYNTIDCSFAFLAGDPKKKPLALLLFNFPCLRPVAEDLRALRSALAREEDKWDNLRTHFAELLRSSWMASVVRGRGVDFVRRRDGDVLRGRAPDLAPRRVGFGFETVSPSLLRRLKRAVPLEPQGEELNRTSGAGTAVTDEPELNQTERKLVLALGRDKLTGEKLAGLAGLPYNSHTKVTLSGLVKRRILNNDRRGYYNPSHEGPDRGQD